jgi:hypothetical protein
MDVYKNRFRDSWRYRRGIDEGIEGGVFLTEDRNTTILAEFCETISVSAVSLTPQSELGTFVDMLNQN